MKKITYITGNQYKVVGAKGFLEPLGFEIDAKDIDCLEIQADTMEEVAKFSSKYASNLLKKNTLKNDSGLVIPSLKGFPGVYTKYVEKTLGVDGVLKLLDEIEDRSAYFIEVLAYTEYGKEPVTFTSKTEGTIAKAPSGENGWSWDFIFIPKGENKTLAHYPDDERWKFWDSTAYVQLANYLKDQGRLEKIERKN